MNEQTILAKLGQMLVVGFHGKTVNDEVKKLIHEYRIGNIILFGRNIGTPEEVRQLTTALQWEAKKAGHECPLLICLDQENGIVRRLKDPTTAFPGPMSLGAGHNPELTQEIGLATARELKELGINWNLAPVVDVNNNPNNPVINVRSFGESPEKVAELAMAWFKGLQQGGVAATLKHFPGHGDTATDSHLDLPVINHTIERLNDVELVPFIEGIKQGTDVIMTAHIYFSALEQEYGKPATLSRNVLTGLLREKLGFKGVITTDCLEMNAIKDTVGVGRGAVEAIKAGADIAMISHTLEYQVDAVKALVEAAIQGGIPEEQINESYQRMIELKDKYTGEWEDVLSSVNSYQYVGSNDHRELAHLAYEQSVCVVAKDSSFSFEKKDSEKVLAIFPQNKATNQAEERQEHSMIAKVIESDPVAITPYEVKDQQEDLVNLVKNYDRVIIFTFTLTTEDEYYKQIQSLASAANSMVISLRGHYPFMYLKAKNALCVFDDTYDAIAAAIDVAFGERKATGNLPVTT